MDNASHMDDLIAEAKELGIQVDHRWNEPRLEQEIEAVKAKMMPVSDPNQVQVVKSEPADLGSTGHPEPEHDDDDHADAESAEHTEPEHEEAKAEG